MMKKKKSALWMRGAGLMLAGMLCGSLPAGAAVKAGEQQVSVNVGAAIPTTKYDLSAVGGKTDLMGGSGVGFGGQYLYHLTPAIGLGGEFNYASYGDKSHSITGATVISSYKTWSLEAVARYVLMPEARVNPYFIAGLGLGSVLVNATSNPTTAWADGSTGTHTNIDSSSTGVAFSVGAGADADITDSLFAGLDLRWRYAGAKKTYPDQAVPTLRYSAPGGSGFAIAGKVGWKFGR